MNNLENNDNALTIYEKLANLIPKVKMIENLESKKNLTFKIREVMDEIKILKEEYDNINPNMESAFFQKKESVEKTISLVINDIENTINLYNNEESKVK